MNEFKIYNEWCAIHNKRACNAHSLKEFMIERLLRGAYAN